jgi:hypothetical protein
MISPTYAPERAGRRWRWAALPQVPVAVPVDRLRSFGRLEPSEAGAEHDDVRSEVVTGYAHAHAGRTVHTSGTRRQNAARRVDAPAAPLARSSHSAAQEGGDMLRRCLTLSIGLLLTGCPETASPSAAPKPPDPSTHDPGPDTVPPSPPPPRGAERNAPPLSH